MCDAPTRCCVPVSPVCERGAVPLSLEGAQIRAQGLETVLYLLRVKVPATSHCGILQLSEESRTGPCCYCSCEGRCTPRVLYPCGLEGSAVPPSKGPRPEGSTIPPQESKHWQCPSVGPSRTNPLLEVHCVLSRCLEVRCVPPRRTPEGVCQGTVGWL